MNSPSAVAIARDGHEAQECTTREKTETYETWKGYDLLSFLESRKGTAVTRQEIAQFVWPEVPFDPLVASKEVDRAIGLLRTYLEGTPSESLRLEAAGEAGYVLVEARQRV